MGGVSLEEVTTTIGAELGSSVGVGVTKGVEDVVRIEGVEELATGEFEAEELVVLVLLSL